MQPRLESLDGMRGVLALSVAVYHLTEATLLPGAYLAVDMFFVMSGLILCHAYGPDFDRYNIRTFFHRRAARLMPVYLVTGLVILLMMEFEYPLGSAYIEEDRHRYSLMAFAAYMGAMQIVAPGFYWNTPGWSVSGELWLSLGLFSALPWIVRVRTGGWLCIAVAAGLYLLTLSSNGNFSVIGGTVWLLPGTVLRPLAGFIMGVGIFKMLRQSEPTPLPLWFIRPVEICLLLICFGLPALIGRTALDFAVVMSSGALMFLLVAHDERLLVPRLLRSRSALFLGAVSYSIYLWHTIVMHFFLRAAHDGWLQIGAIEIAAYVALVIVIAYVSYVAIEQPSKEWLNARLGPINSPMPAAQASSSAQ